jgi:hypothetical protein
MVWKAAHPLLKLLQGAIERVPSLKFAYGAVGIAAAGGLAALVLGQSRAAIIIWILAFCATVLVTVFARMVGSRAGSRLLAGRLLINTVVIVFCGFLLLTITAFMNLGPRAWADFLGIENQAKVTDFSQAGGVVNFGCEAGNTATVEYHAPEGYRILNAAVEPLDPRAAKTVTPRLLSNDGKTAKGQVDYFGRDRDWVRNCDGGGHGAVVIKGQIVREASSTWPLISALLALSLIAGIITLFGSPPPPQSGSRTRRTRTALRPS